MAMEIAAVAAGIALLYFGAEGLVSGSANLARHCRLTPLVIGLTVVAFGTSMPELVVSVDAALSGSAAIATGNVVGSNIANIALILGLSALLCPMAVSARLVRVDMPLLVLISVLLIVMLLDQRLGRVEGTLLALGLLVYTTATLRSARRETAAASAAGAPQQCAAPASITLARSVMLTLGGLVLLVLGARLLVTGAVSLADDLGVSEALIGLTIVAVGTSLPELATSVLAALRRQGDIAIGNVVGSNIFNILGVLGFASLARPLEQTGMSVVDLAVMLLLAVVLVPLARSGWRLGRAEGVLLLGSYAAYLLYLV